MKLKDNCTSRTGPPYGGTRTVRESDLGVCGVHGPAIFDLTYGCCLICLGESVNLPTAQAYKNSGSDRYPSPCADCGKETPHFIASGRCAICFDRWNRRRRTTARTVARRAGLASFESNCENCGGVRDHWTATGKCRACQTRAGAVRVRPPHDPARADARRAGRPAYDAPCMTCGGVRPHGVRYGRCLQCFTVDGVTRR